MIAYIFDETQDPLGLNPVTSPIPAEHAAQAKEYRDKLIEAVSDFDDVIAEKYLGGEEISVDELMLGIRKATISLQFTGVIPGSAFKKKGVQRLLDCVVNYLPSPDRRPADAGPGQRRQADRGRRSTTSGKLAGSRVQALDRPVCRQARVLPRLHRDS